MLYCPIIAEKYGLVPAVASGIVFNLFSFVCGVISSLMDWHAEQVILQGLDYEKNKYS